MARLYWTFDEAGGFVCGDAWTGLTAYSYPTSENAEAAKIDAAGVAERVTRCDYNWRGSRVATEIEAEYDRRNWEKLNSLAGSRFGIASEVRA